MAAGTRLGHGSETTHLSPKISWKALKVVVEIMIDELLEKEWKKRKRMERKEKEKKKKKKKPGEVNPLQKWPPLDHCGIQSY